MEIILIYFHPSLFDIDFHFLLMYFDSMGLENLLKRVLSKREEFGDTWYAMQEKLLMIYREALSSDCRHLVQLIQVILFLIFLFSSLCGKNALSVMVCMTSIVFNNLNSN